jgi:hypothetical protein
MAHDEQGFPVVPHEFIPSVECDGCLIVHVFGEQAEIACNECGAVVRIVPSADAEATLLGIAMASGEICSARCTHCGAWNTFPGFSAIEAFICSECGEGVAVNRPVQ